MLKEIINEVINCYIKQIITESKNDKKVTELVKQFNIYDEDTTNSNQELIN